MEMKKLDSENVSILIVEDDPDINNLLKKLLSKAGFVPTQVYSGTEATLRINVEPFDLVLLDLMLPGITGEELIIHIRETKGLSIPVIAISAKVTTADKVNVLGSGADDYITKPFVAEEVIARIEAVLRRSEVESGKANSYKYKDLVLDSDTRRVQLKNADIQLTAHEFDLLEILIKRPDMVFSRERLYQMIWNGEYYGEDNTINVHVSNIRKKLAAESDDEYIRTIWGIGFKLV